MNSGNDITEELKGLHSPLAEIARTMPYAVPDGYFALLAESVAAGIGAADDYTLPIQNKNTPYQIPGGYFEKLPEAVLQAARNRQEGQKAANAYILPDGYFDQLPMQMLEAAKQANAPVKRKAIPLRAWKPLRWAAAALLILGIGFGGYKVMNPATVWNTETELAQLPNGTISEYVQAHIDEFDTELITANINTTNNTPPTATGQLEDEEIIRYLNETGWEGTNIN